MAVRWIDVAEAADVPRDGHRVYPLEDRYVAVYDVAGDLFAIEDVCTHDGESLAGGEVEDHEVICPRHGARFCLRTGAALTPPAYSPVATFAVRRMDGRLWLGVP